MANEIYCFCGKKQSGKNTGANYLLGSAMFGLGLIREFGLNDTGQLWVRDDNNDISWIDYASRKWNPTLDDFLKEYVDDTIKLYGFADALKDLICEFFGTEPKLAYGTDEDKNTLTQLKWGDMPGWVGPEIARDDRMSIRQLLQFFGTEVMRKMWEPVWVNKLIRQIDKDDPMIAVVYDCRFDNEARALQKVGAMNIKLTRGIEGDHASENGFKEFTSFKYTIDNKNMTIPEANTALAQIMKKEQFFGLFEIDFELENIC